MSKFSLSLSFRLIFVFCFVLSGSVYSIITNSILNSSIEIGNKLSFLFQFPVFLVFISQAGKLLLLIPVFYEFIREKDFAFSWSKILLFRNCFLPAFLEIIATSLQNYALIYIPLPVWQLFHGFQMLFTTVIAVTLRDARLFLADWLGLFLTVAGICIAGAVSLIRGIVADPNAIPTMFFSIILVFFSHALRSLQVILEEKLTHDQDIPPSKVVAYEGIWGVFLIGFIILPYLNILKSSFTFYENTIEAFQIVSKDRVLLILVLVYLANTSLHQYFGVGIIAFATAIHRNLYELIKIPLVWLISSILFYFIKLRNVGYEFDAYSFGELAGFFVAVFGNLVFNRIITFCCFTYVNAYEDTPLIFLDEISNR